MGDLGGVTSQLTSSSYGRDVKLEVPCLDAACTVGLELSVARSPDEPTQNKLETNKKTKQRAVAHMVASATFLCVIEFLLISLTETRTEFVKQ